MCPEGDTGRSSARSVDSASRATNAQVRKCPSPGRVERSCSAVRSMRRTASVPRARGAVALLGIRAAALTVRPPGAWSGPSTASPPAVAPRPSPGCAEAVVDSRRGEPGPFVRPPGARSGRLRSSPTTWRSGPFPGRVERSSRSCSGPRRQPSVPRAHGAVVVELSVDAAARVPSPGAWSGPQAGLRRLDLRCPSPGCMERSPSATTADIPVWPLPRVCGAVDDQGASARGLPVPSRARGAVARSTDDEGAPQVRGAVKGFAPDSQGLGRPSPRCVERSVGRPYSRR